MMTELFMRRDTPLRMSFKGDHSGFLYYLEKLAANLRHQMNASLSIWDISFAIFPYQMSYCLHQK